MAAKEHESDGADGKEGALPPRLRMKLASMKDLTKELGRLYRETRAGRIDTQDASRMANMLAILGRLIEGSDMEARVEALEEALAKAESTPRAGTIRRVR